MFIPQALTGIKRGGALSQALANLKGTADVELAGEAKRAAAAKPEALVLWAQDGQVQT